MMKASEYRRHAAECRALAAAMASPDHKAQLIKMAETWDSMAAERERIARTEEATTFTPSIRPKPKVAWP